MKSPVPSRADWQKRRDKAEIDKGAVAKVSIGDRLDKFHKALKASGYKAAAAEVVKLKKDLETYQKALEKKNPKVKALVGQLLAEVTEHQEIGAKVFNLLKLTKNVALKDLALEIKELDEASKPAQKYGRPDTDALMQAEIKLRKKYLDFADKFDEDVKKLAGIDLDCFDPFREMDRDNLYYSNLMKGYQALYKERFDQVRERLDAALGEWG